MTKITYVTKSGTEVVIDARDGTTVMENAIRNNISGIEAECGGNCSCATCHVYVDPVWRDIAGQPGAFEADLLEMAFDVRPSSRLSCQIKVTAALDGLRVIIPQRQT